MVKTIWFPVDFPLNQSIDDRQVTLDPDNQNELRGASFARIPPGPSASVASSNFGGQAACGSILTYVFLDTKARSKHTLWKNLT